MLSTRTDGEADVKQADMGFHHGYRSPGPPPPPPPEYPVTVTLRMPGRYFTPGSRFYLDADTVSRNGKPVDCCLFVLLESAGTFWSYPSWTAFGPPSFTIDFENVTVLDETCSIIPGFSWPFVPVSMGFRFYGCCADPGLTGLQSNLDVLEWACGL